MSARPGFNSQTGLGAGLQLNNYKRAESARLFGSPRSASANMEKQVGSPDTIADKILANPLHASLVIAQSSEEFPSVSAGN